MEYLRLLKVVVVILVFVEAQDSELTAKEAFEQNGLVPEFIPRGPDSTCSVVYPTGLNSVDLGRGSQMVATDTRVQPTVDWDADSDALYTLIMIDPDFPTPQPRNLIDAYLHLLIANIPGSDVAAGDVLANYMILEPTPGPAHRYTFVVYKQNGRVTNDLATQEGSVVRAHFSIPTYTSQHDMYGPVAGNFFYEKTVDGTENGSIGQTADNAL